MTDYSWNPRERRYYGYGLDHEAGYDVRTDQLPEDASDAEHAAARDQLLRDNGALERGTASDDGWIPALTHAQLDDVARYLTDERREHIHSEAAPCEPTAWVRLYADQGADWRRELLECAELAGVACVVAAALPDSD